MRTSLQHLAGRVSLALAGWMAAGALVPAAFAHRIEKRFPVDVQPTITVRNKSGKVSIKSWNKQEVLVVANHVSEKTEVDAKQLGNRIEVITHLLSESIAPGEMTADFEITVPAESAVQIHNDSGTVFVERVTGDLSFDTVAAGVDLKEVAGYLIIKTVNGSITCYLCAGRIEVNTIAGNVKFLRPISSNVRAQTWDGSIFFDGAFEKGGTYKLSSFSGGIEVRFSEADSFDLKATTQEGKLENQASLKPSSRSKVPASSAGFVSGTYNLGLARVDLSSYSGTIKVLRRGEN